MRGVGAHRSKGEDDVWRVEVWAAELVREEVAEEDRKVWCVYGEPTGEALVRAAAEVVDSLAAEIRDILN